MSQVQKMNWYQGDIAAAISMSKSKGAIFVVYIEGKDEKSAEITRIVNTEDVASKLGGEHFVAIKIEANTIPHQQFSQIYKQTPVPSMYFIGKQGVPLEIITEAKDASTFATNLDGILQKAGIAPSKSNHQQQQSSDLIRQEQHQEEAAAAAAAPVALATPSTSFSSHPVGKATEKKTEDSAQKSSTSLADDSSQKKKENEEKEKEKVPVSDDVAHETTDEVVTTTQSPHTTEREGNNVGEDSLETSMTPEEKIERAKQLVEQKRSQKQKEEEEKERQKELERRKMGQNVQQLKRWQEDQELKQVMEERERERREQQMARERVLAQIAQDKAERAARYSAANQQPGTPSYPQSPTTTTASPQPSPRSPSFNTHTARIQFKMPDGSCSTRDFPSTETLETVHRYIREHLNLTFPHYTLSTTFPRREFTETDRLLSLAQLELVPSAVILILPLSSRGGTVSTNVRGGGGGMMNRGLTGMIWSLLTPFINLLGYLRTFVFGTGTPAATAGGGSGGQAAASGGGGGTTTTTSGGESSINKRAGGPQNDQFRFQAKRRPGSESSTVIRRQGNIARLSNATDSDEDNNTWNGNSTQQM